MVLLDENKVLKNKRFIHTDYAYFGFIRSSGNKICFNFGDDDDDIRGHLYVLDGFSLEILHKLETASITNWKQFRLFINIWKQRRFKYESIKLKPHIWYYF